MNHLVFFFYLFCLFPGFCSLMLILQSILDKKGGFYIEFFIFISSLTFFEITFLLHQYGVNSSSLSFQYPGQLYIVFGVLAIGLLLLSGPLLLARMCGKEIQGRHYSGLLFLAFIAVILNSFVLQLESQILKLSVILVQVIGIILYMLVSLIVIKKRGQKLATSWMFNRIFYISLFAFPFLVIDYFIDHIKIIKAIFPYGLFAFPLYFLVLNISIILAFLGNRPSLSTIKSSDITLSETFKADYGITQREGQVIELLIKGISYIQMADQLFISLKTVKTHAYNIYKKTGVHNRMELHHLILNP